MRLSRLRWAVLYSLAKASQLGVPVPVGRLVRVFNLNSGLVYRFLRELEAGGVAESVGRGLWRLRDTPKARSLAEYLLAEPPGSPHGYWSSSVPETHYYIAEPPSIEWLGYPEATLVVVDEGLRGRISPPGGYLVVYASMRGRRWRYDWGQGVARAVAEQALADLLSYDPGYPVEQYIYLNMGRVDLDEVARRATPGGLRRLATFLAFLRTATGREPPTSIDYLSLADSGVLGERLGEYVGLVFANGVAEERGI